ncbi:hypothetical protein I6J35_12805 [Staphylococcus condimenti]|uniref:hypothetical protein n=1 Tax=Staphylococcus condimenti TaxID=70255 RepID=UPI00164350F9|nr:hypothetical protein [Staphylococcus condimenti]QRP95496.1 hypothetical protein I6J35_12805 [Staphylococcus condimenti]
MKIIYLFIIYYIIGLIIFNGIIFIFGGDFELDKSLLLPLIAVIVGIVLSKNNKEKKGK